VTPLVLAVAAAGALGLSACTTGPGVTTAPTSAPSTSAPATAPAAPAATTATVQPSEQRAKPAARALPSAHVHAVSREPSTGELLVATHEGLYVYGKGGPRKVGPDIDLMGFTVAGPRHYYASGHPGAGVDLPQPAGLLESRDGGRTWTVLSRGGSSDFHALTAAGQRVVAFDGTLRLSSGGRSWQTGDLASPPRTLAISPDGERVLATTAEGLMSSGDGGARWKPVAGAPLLLLVDWVDSQAVAGLTPQGELHLSTDAGQTWRATAAVATDVQALEASRGEGGGVEVVAATHDQLVTSRDGGPFAE